MYNEQMSEQVAAVSCIDPDAYTVGTYNGDVIDMSKWNRVLFVVMVGDLGTSGTVDYKLQGSVTGSSGWTDLSSKSITQLTQAGTDSDKQALIEITAEELAGYGSGTFRYIRDALIVGTAGSDCGAIAFASCPRFQPARDDDLASVDEIVT